MSALLCYSVKRTPDIYTLPLHDALPIFTRRRRARARAGAGRRARGARAHAERGARGAARGAGLGACALTGGADEGSRSEEHTSELQSQSNLVCRLLLEKKKRIRAINTKS